MRSVELAVTGAFVFTADVFSDDRGRIVSLLQQPTLLAAAGQPVFSSAQVSYSRSREGVVRGVHYTRTPPGCSKFVFVPCGRALDIVADTRVGSPTYGRWDSVILGPEHASAVYLPVGVGHGFVSMADNTIMMYLLSEPYDAGNEASISVFDTDLALPLPDTDPILSARDRAAPTLTEAAAAGLLPDYATLPCPGTASMRGKPMPACRICGGLLYEFIDFGRQLLANAFRLPDDASEELCFRLAVGICDSCGMVQLVEEVPRELMFHEGYPYYSSGSARMRAHFEATAQRVMDIAGPDGFVVELGSNDGVLLHVLAGAGRRHLGIEPSGAVARVAAARGVRVRGDFFDADVAAEISASDGPADVIFAANTMGHIPYINAVLDGVTSLLAPGGRFVFEDPYFADILAQRSFDQIYDEHFYFFTAGSVSTLAACHGLELVDVERLGAHGGEVRYTLMRFGARSPSAAVAELLAEESEKRITEEPTLKEFQANVEQIRADLVGLLSRLRADGRTVVGYGATAKSATVTNFCGIGPDLVSYICDTTPAKQGRRTPGAGIPVRPHSAFAASYPDYALLFAWNHAAEIMANEPDFTRAGGRWIHYVPEVFVAP